MKVLSFADCLSNLMRKNGISAALLASLAGGRLDLKKILADSSSPAKRNQLFQAVQASGIFSHEDCKELESALEASRIGVEHYKAQKAIERILSGQIPDCPSELRTEKGVLLQEALTPLLSADKVEILCINCCFYTVSSALLPFFESKEKDVSMWHLIHADAKSAASCFVAAVFPLLFDSRYQPYAMRLPSDAEIHPIGGNLLAVRAFYGSKVEQKFFQVLSEKEAIEILTANTLKPFEHLSRVLQLISPLPVPLKESHAQHVDYALLCMNYLSHELNRATYSVANDIYFQQTPSDIAVSALRDKGSFSAEEVELLIQRVLPIHEQRYQNQYVKKKSTYRVMTVIGCERFLKTGLCSDHFFGFRPFTVAERKQIFGKMLSAAESNPHFIPLLMKDHRFECRHNLVCYDKLGISIDLTNTDYDMQKGYRSVFLTYPEFTQQYMDYYLSTLVREKCHTQQESLQLLKSMYENFLKENP